MLCPFFLFSFVNIASALSNYPPSLPTLKDARTLPTENTLTVHIVAMNHLDVGYNGIPTMGLINNILNIYFDEYFPRAIEMANAMRTAGGEDRFIYTTHAWLLHMYLHCPENFMLSAIPLHCPNETSINNLKAAIKRGDIYWHAGPFNTEYENCDNPEAAALQFQYAFQLADELGVPRPHVVSVRDVPGVTRSMIPIFVANNITALTVGVNGGSPAPHMPNPGIWSDPATKTSVFYMQTAQGQGYPNNPGPDPFSPGGMDRDSCVFFATSSHVLCWAFRSDNSGPPLSVSEIQNQYKIARQQWPGATVQASTYEDFVDSFLAEVERDTLPMVSYEVGDTWITSTTADPVKMKWNRIASRAYSACVKNKQCNTSDPRIINFGRMLIKLPEHTYGFPGISDNVNYTNKDFQRAFATNNSAEFYAQCSYTEQRDLAFNYGLNALEDHPLRKSIENEWAAVQPEVPGTTGMVAVPQGDWGQVFTVGANAQLAFDPSTGGISTFTVQGTSWADPKHLLGTLVYQTFSDSDYNRYPICCWGEGDRQKLANPNTTNTTASLTALYTDNLNNPTEFLLELDIPDSFHETYGAPSRIFLRYTVTSSADHKGSITLSMDLNLRDCSLTRLGNAFFLNFIPSPQKQAKWRMNKLDGWVDPADVVENGSQWQHTVRSVRYSSSNGGLFVEPIDNGVMNPITASQPAQIFQMPLTPITDPIIGFGAQLMQNAFSTNTPLFQWDGNYRFRLSMTAA